MNRTAGRTRLRADYFERLYAAHEDPWSFATSDYERAKYAHTLAASGERRYRRGLEVGCSIGVLSAMLADRCDELVAIDVSARALAAARRRLAGRAGVRFAPGEFPESMPGGSFDLIVCSEVLYYLDPPSFTAAVARLRAALECGSTLLAVHWRGATTTYPMDGDEVHDGLLAELGSWHDADERRPRYRLDRFGPR